MDLNKLVEKEEEKQRERNCKICSHPKRGKIDELCHQWPAMKDRCSLTRLTIIVRKSVLGGDSLHRETLKKHMVECLKIEEADV